MKSLYQHSGRNRFSIVEESVYGLVQHKFLLPNISKIKNKMLVNLSVASQND